MATSSYLKKCDQLQTDIFETRLMFEKTICMRGVEAAKSLLRHGQIYSKKTLPLSEFKKRCLARGAFKD